MVTLGPKWPAWAVIIVLLCHRPLRRVARAGVPVARSVEKLARCGCRAAALQPLRYVVGADFMFGLATGVSGRSISLPSCTAGASRGGENISC